jgi:hypothetical protein
MKPSNKAIGKSQAFDRPGVGARESLDEELLNKEVRDMDVMKKI